MSTIAASLEKIKASREQARARRLYASNARTFKRREYQDKDIQWLIENKRGILAHAPGLGKTFCALEAAETPILVTCPSTLTTQWADFIKDQYPHWSVVDCSKGNPLQRDKALNSDADVRIVNHDMHARFFMPKVQTVIADEFHNFRHKDAQRSKNFNVYVNANKIPRVYGLTATPVYKDAGDLWHQLNILWPEKFPSENDFLGTYTHQAGGWGSRVIGVRNKRALDNMLKTYMRELTYKQAGMFLPDRIDKDVKLELDPQFRKNVYDKLRIQFKIELQGMDGMPEIKLYETAGAMLHMLRRILIDEFKLEAIKQIVDDIQHDRPIAVFCWYKDSAAKIAEALDAAQIDGSMTPEHRREVAYHGGPKRKRVRVITMASMTEGVDLSFMRDVIFAESDYVPGKNYQAMTRVQRARTEEGYDKDPVIAYWPRYMNTVDEVVYKTARDRATGSALSVLREALEGI